MNLHEHLLIELDAARRLGSQSGISIVGVLVALIAIVVIAVAAVIAFIVPGNN
jgi:hypothetical protein